MQIVGYEPTAIGPALVLADSDAIERQPLAPGTHLEYTLKKRRCAGAVDGTTHHSCDRSVAPYCEFHRQTWVCARCTGSCLKDEMDCHEEHAVYLAAFAPNTFKVGVTKRWRLETRLREQGADRAAHIHTVSDGRIARQLEAAIAADIGVSDRIRSKQKVEGLARSVDMDRWLTFLENFGVIETFDLTYDFDRPLRARPVRETIAAGTVVGVQGRLVVLERAGTTYAVDLRDLVGYEVDTGGESDGRRLQSSLGSFG